MTRKEMFNAIKDFVCNNDPQISAGDILEFCDAEIAKLEKRSTKKESFDELLELVQNALTADYQVISDIMQEINNDEYTASKIINRLSRLVSNGVAEKATISIAGTNGVKARRLTAYRLKEIGETPFFNNED